MKVLPISWVGYFYAGTKIVDKSGILAIVGHMILGYNIVMPYFPKTHPIAKMLI
jgi:hypothetical protein